VYEAIPVPEGIELNEWLAVNTTDFYNSTMLLYSTLVEFCTNETCPVMSAGPKVSETGCVNSGLVLTVTQTPLNLLPLSS